MTDMASPFGGGLTPEQTARLLQVARESAARQAGQPAVPQPLDAQLAFIDKQIAALTAETGTDTVPDYPDQAGAVEMIKGLRVDLLQKQRYICLLEHAVRMLMSGELTAGGTAG